MSNASIITVWGSPGAGKSTFAAILARYLTRDKSKAIIISPDLTTPMLPVWFPNESIENRMSLGHILSSHEINNSIIAERVKLLRAYPYVGVLGYTSGDMPLSYPDVAYDKVVQLIEVAAGMVDYLILDCPPRVTDLFTPAAIELADIVVSIFAPDLRGISYRKAQTPLLAGEKFKLDKHLIFAGCARPYYAIDEMEHVVGHVDGLLPWIKELDRAATEGVIFSAGKYCTDRYLQSLRLVRDRISGGDADGEPE